MLVIGPNLTKFWKLPLHPNNILKSKQTVISTNLLTPIKEVRTKGKPLPGKLKRPTVEHRILIYQIRNPQVEDSTRTGIRGEKPEP